MITRPKRNSKKKGGEREENGIASAQPRESRNSEISITPEIRDRRLFLFSSSLHYPRCPAVSYKIRVSIRVLFQKFPAPNVRSQFLSPSSRRGFPAILWFISRYNGELVFPQWMSTSRERLRRVFRFASSFVITERMRATDPCSTQWSVSPDDPYLPAGDVPHEKQPSEITQDHLRPSHATTHVGQGDPELRILWRMRVPTTILRTRSQSAADRATGLSRLVSKWNVEYSTRPTLVFM